MVPIGFDQTNGKAAGLRGDDDGSIATALPERTVENFLQRLFGAGSVGTSAADHDPSVTAYSEEGAF